MPQVLLIDSPGSPREALVYALRSVQVDVQAVEELADAQSWLKSADLRLVIAAHTQLETLRQSGHLWEIPGPRLWVLLDSGNFPGLIAALQLGASEIIWHDRAPRDVAALVRGELALPVSRRTPEDGGGVTIELEGHAEPFQVPPERLIGLLAQMSEEISRLNRRYSDEQQQRRKVEKALVESEAFYQSLVETLPLALFRKDRDGRVTFANQRFCDVLRRKPTEILGRTDYDFFPRALAEKYRADDRRVMESRLNLETVEEFRTPSGDQRFNQVVKTPVFDNSGQLVGIQGVFSDVTDRILTESALEQEQNLLDSLMHNSPDNIYFKDTQGRYLRINPAKARRSGLADPADAIGRSDFDFFSAEHAQHALADELQVLQTGEPLLSKEERISYADGTQAWMSTTKLPLKDRQGKVIGTFGVSHDITALKEAQHALRRAAMEAELASRAKSDFLANMSHEIRTPLNAVLGMTELVLGSSLTPVQRDYLRLVQESGESLLAVINDILDFSKIEAGKLQLDASPFDFREFMGDTLKSLGLRAHRKGLELVCDIHRDLPDRLCGDANRLRQVIVNLVGNAIKFTEQGEVLARVTVETPAVPEEGNPDAAGSDIAGPIPISLHFEVSDTGIGIPVEKFHTIFQAFEQADASTTRRFGGTGLGLAISARLVNLMGGRIWVDSEVGRGSTFHFTAQFRLADAASPESPPTSPELLQGLRVLIVDDNSTNRRILAEMLASWGIVPLMAAGTAEALEVLQHQAELGTPLKLVVTDVNMPEQSGFDLVKAVRREGALQCGVIVMLTSGDRTEELQTCVELGVDTYLIKPVKQSELFNAILQALGARHAEDWREVSTGVHRMTGRPMKILLAEDSQINQKLAVALLERWGHEVDVAENGSQAVAMVQSRPYNVVLMDVQMPEMDGFAATAAIRDHERRAGETPLPIIAMTAHALPGDRERCLAAGMDDYLSKPIRSEVLFQTLEQLAVSAGPAVQEMPTFATRSGRFRRSQEIPANSPATVANPGAMANPNAVANPGTGAGSTMGHDRDSDVQEDEVMGLIDWKHARATVDDDEELLQDVAEAFCEEAPRQWEQLQAAIDRNQPDVCQRSAHTLKNSLSIFGATTAARKALEIELQIRNTQKVPSLKDCQRLGDYVEAVVSELKHTLPAKRG